MQQCRAGASTSRGHKSAPLFMCIVHDRKGLPIIDKKYAQRVGSGVISPLFKMLLRDFSPIQNQKPTKPIVLTPLSPPLQISLFPPSFLNP
ncbi:hypothetical protein L1887_12540 [Cichorium endivia]|nr:hypothetical protein L1887_12540 [Cichorium endivia]